MKNNDFDFAFEVLTRLWPEASVELGTDRLISTSGPYVAFLLKDYRPAILDLRLFTERYEKCGVSVGDARTVDEMRMLRAVPIPPPVSTGHGVPAVDPFAPPVGLPDQGRFGAGEKSK